MVSVVWMTLRVCSWTTGSLRMQWWGRAPVLVFREGGFVTEERLAEGIGGAVHCVGVLGGFYFRVFAEKLA